MTAGHFPRTPAGVGVLMMGLAGNRSTRSPGRSAALATGIVVVAILAASASWLVWTVVKPLPQTASQPTGTRAAGETLSLAERFLRIPEVRMISAGAPFSAPASSGGFTLYAVRADADGGGTAIISANGSPQASYAVGDEIAPGAVLSRVGPDWVEIQSGGRRTVLGFSNSVQHSLGADTRRTDLPAPLVNALPASGRADGGYRVTQADLAYLPGSGLQAGDVILTVNGAPVSSSTLSQHVVRLQTGGSVSIVYSRNGQVATTRIGSQ